MYLVLNIISDEWWAEVGLVSIETLSLGTTGIVLYYFCMVFKLGCQGFPKILCANILINHFLLQTAQMDSVVCS